LHDGHGLGLYITKKLITLMRGTITVKSEGEGKGTTFTCRIPLALTDQPLKPLMLTPQSRAEVQYQQSTRQSMRAKQQIDNQQATMPDTATIRYRVLVVEDNTIAARVALQYLQRQQCDVTVASTAKEALSWAEGTHYDCIFMDVGLPDGDGRDITQTIRSGRHFPNVHTPIIGLTAHANTDIQQACLAAGMNIVYCKPLNPERVHTVLNDIVVRPDSVLRDKKQVAKNKHAYETMPVLDLTASMQVLQCDEHTARELLDQFMVMLQTDKAQLKETFNRRETTKWKPLNTLVHRIRGACGYCGAARLQQRCADFETQYDAKADETILVTHYQAIIDDIAELEKIYQKITGSGS
jgi:CheY-like chemotaxis protein